MTDRRRARGRPSRGLLSDHVRDELLRRIHSGELAVGSKLPNEQELCDLFEVSRITVREAVRSLVEAGYLNRLHGSGTFVAFRPSARHTLDRNLSYTKMIDEAGMRPSRRVLAVEREPIDDLVAKRLGVSVDDEVYRIDRVRYADEHPAIFSVDTIPVSVLGDDVPEDRFGASFYSLLSSVGHEIATAEATLLPVLADARHEEILGVPEGSPLLHIAQVDSTTSGLRVIHSLEWHVPGVFELTLLRRPG